MINKTIIQEEEIDLRCISFFYLKRKEKTVKKRMIIIN